MYTRYFRIETQNNPITSKQVMEALTNTYTSAIEAWDSVLEVNHIEGSSTIAEKMQMAKGTPDKPQQSTVPIQFVWHDGVVMREECFLGMIGDPHKIENCTVEQIGAVLYVRDKE